MSAIPYLFAPHLLEENFSIDLPPTDEPNVWVKVIHRFKTTWERIGKRIVVTPGCSLEYVNQHLVDVHLLRQNEPGAATFDWSDAVTPPGTAAAAAEN